MIEPASTSLAATAAMPLLKTFLSSSLGYFSRNLEASSSDVEASARLLRQLLVALEYNRSVLRSADVGGNLERYLAVLGLMEVEPIGAVLIDWSPKGRPEQFKIDPDESPELAGSTA